MRTERIVTPLRRTKNKRTMRKLLRRIAVYNRLYGAGRDIPDFWKLESYRQWSLRQHQESCIYRRGVVVSQNYRYAHVNNPGRWACLTDGQRQRVLAGWQWLAARHINSPTVQRILADDPVGMTSQVTYLLGCLESTIWVKSLPWNQNVEGEPELQW